MECYKGFERCSYGNLPKSGLDGELFMSFTRIRFPTTIAMGIFRICWCNVGGPTSAPVEVGSLSHYLRGFSTIPGGDRRISEPLTVSLIEVVNHEYLTTRVPCFKKVSGTLSEAFGASRSRGRLQQTNGMSRGRFQWVAPGIWDWNPLTQKISGLVFLLLGNLNISIFPSSVQGILDLLMVEWTARFFFFDIFGTAWIGAMATRGISFFQRFLLRMMFQHVSMSSRKSTWVTVQQDLVPKGKGRSLFFFVGGVKGSARHFYLILLDLFQVIFLLSTMGFITIFHHHSRQFIATSAEVTSNGGLVRESPQNGLKSG